MALFGNKNNSGLFGGFNLMQPIQSLSKNIGRSIGTSLATPKAPVQGPTAPSPQAQGVAKTITGVSGPTQEQLAAGLAIPSSTQTVSSGPTPQPSLTGSNQPFTNIGAPVATPPQAQIEVPPPLPLPVQPTAAIPQPTQAPDPFTDLQSQLTDLRNQLAGLATPSAEEQATLEQLNQFNEAARLGISGLEGQGRGIEVGLVRGQQGKLAEQANIQAQTLEQRLANLQGQRVAQQQSLGMQLQGAEQEFSRLQQQEQQAQAQAQPFEFGGNLVRFNPATGQLETIAEAPQQQISELDLIKLETARLNLEKLGIDVEMAKRGETGLKPLSGDAAKVLTIAQTMIPEVERLKEIFSENPAAKILGFTTGTNRELVKLVEDVSDKVGRLRSGGAINDQEAAAFQRQIVSLGDLLDPGSITTALDRIIEEAQGVALGIQGSTGSGALDDAFAGTGFSGDLSTSVNGSDIQSAAALVPQGDGPVSIQANSSIGGGTITAYGSSFWDPGLDYVLSGGKGADVAMPVPMQVIGVIPSASSGGFGNQVRLMTSSGQEIWFSHLDDTFVQPGQVMQPGQVFGLQGNSGNVIASSGGTGTHLDITMPRVPNPSFSNMNDFFTAQEVAAFLNVQ